MAYMTCEDLTLGYDGHIVTEHIQFSVEKGDYLYILGENGTGKSTLMKTLLHLLQPMSGKILYGDEIMPYEIGYLPQQTMIQKDFPASVWEIVLSGNLAKCKGMPFYKKAHKEMAEKNMRKMDVWHLRKKCYRYLSGGQQQRVLLARALCATEKLLLLDEPISGLDPKVTIEFYNLLDRLNQDGITIMMVSHDINAALEYGKKILHIGKEQMFFGKKEDYLKSKAYELLCKGAKYE